MTFSFPALAAVDDQLKQIFAEAGPDLNLSKVTCIGGTDSQKAWKIRELNDQREELLKVADAAGGASEGGRVPGAENGGSGAGWAPDSLSERPLKTGESLLERCTKAAGRNPWPNDEEWRLSVLGAMFKNDSAQTERLLKHYKAPGALGGAKAMDTSGAAVIVPLPIAADVIDRLRAAAVTQLLGAQTVGMTSKTLKIPRLTGDPTVSWLNEGASVTASDAQMDSVTLTAQRLTGLTLVSQELAEDSDPAAVGDVLAMSFGRALGTEIDRVSLKGSGTSPEPRGIRNQTGVSVNATAAAAAWTVVTERVGVLLGANVPLDNIGIAVNVASWATLFATVGSDGHYVEPPYSMPPSRILSTSTLAAPATGELYAGDFSELILGIRVALDFQILRERYADSGQIGVLPRVRADVQVRHGASFALRTALST
jgi:HK97 family phage major capsid protein